MTTFASFASAPVRASFELDEGPGRHRIGLIALSNDYAIERDFMKILPNEDAVAYVSRIQNTTDCTVESLRGMGPHITATTSLLVPEGRLDVVAYACTSGTVVMGFEAVRDYVQAARPGVACVTPITASLAALERFEAKRLAVLTPYVDDVNDSIAAYLRAAGYAIEGFTSFQIEDNELMARIPPSAIFDAALEADRPDAEALFISCTAIRAVDVVERIERRLGKPVVTANQALIWQSLRVSGYDEPIDGYGELLRLPA